MIFYFLQKLFSKKVDYKQMMADGAIIVDVRSAGEYSSGHIDKSLNIPLDQLGRQVEKLKKLNKPVITVCLSGTRSGMAASELKQAGINAVNGGPWFMLKRSL
jgi:phage shock protein E